MQYIRHKKCKYWIAVVYHVRIVAIDEEILAYGNRLRSTHCQKVPLFETLRSNLLRQLNHYLTLTMSSGRFRILCP